MEPKPSNLGTAELWGPWTEAPKSSSSITIGVCSRTGDSSRVHSARGVEKLLKREGEPSLWGDPGGFPWTEFLEGDEIGG